MKRGRNSMCVNDTRRVGRKTRVDVQIYTRANLFFLKTERTAGCESAEKTDIGKCKLPLCKYSRRQIKR